MKKVFKYLVISAISFIPLAANVNAEVIDASKLENSYVIGTYLFTEDSDRLTIDKIMLAAKTIEGDSLEDMIIYYKPAGVDNWYNVNKDNAIVDEPKGIKEDNYFTYIDLEPQPEALEKLQLKDSTNIDTSQILDDPFGTNIKFNQDAISVDYNKNIITVTENVLMKSWNNGYLDAKWYGILVDLGIPKDRVTTAEGYTIEDIDKTDAGRFGATNDNQFVLWLKGNDPSRVITFIDKETNEALAITINFNEVELRASGVTTVPTEGEDAATGSALEIAKNFTDAKVELEGNIIKVSGFINKKFNPWDLSDTTSTTIANWYGIRVLFPSTIVGDGTDKYTIYYGSNEREASQTYKEGATAVRLALSLEDVKNDGYETDGTFKIQFDWNNDGIIDEVFYIDTTGIKTSTASTIEELNKLLENENVKTIYLADNFDASAAKLDINRSVTIIGTKSSIFGETVISADNVKINNVNFNKALLVTGSNVTLDGVTMKDVSSPVETGKGDNYQIIKVESEGNFTLINSTIDNTNSTGKFYNAIRIETPGKVTIEKNTFINMTNVYNVIEFSQTIVVGNETTISGNEFYGQNTNNVINMFNFNNDSVINVLENYFEYSGNALRISNYTNANNIIINIENNKYDNTLDGDYAGFMLFQEVKNESFAGITINVKNLIGPDDTKITAETVGKYTFGYYYSNHSSLTDDNYATINYLD